MKIAVMNQGAWRLSEPEWKFLELKLGRKLYESAPCRYSASGFAIIPLECGLLDSLPRDGELLVSLAESEISETFKVVEIPDDVKWEIAFEEVDRDEDREYVAEVHRTWGKD